MRDPQALSVLNGDLCHYILKEKKKFNVKLSLIHIYAKYLPCVDDISHYSHYTTRIGNQISQPSAILPSIIILLSFINDCS